MLDVALLGTGGMMPLPNRFLSSLCVRINGRLCIVDCGEGTQVSHKILGWGFKNIDAIFFTHFHADHISGLPGLLLTIGNSGRVEPLTLAGPEGLEKVVASLLVIAQELPFTINFIELPFIKGTEHKFSAAGLTVGAYPLNHRIPCFAYSFTLPRPGKFDAARAESRGVPLKLWSVLQRGETASADGFEYTPDMVLGPERAPIKVSYCTDTKSVNGVARFIAGSDLFVCEGLYAEDEKLEKAREHHHMIFSEAAAYARDGGAGELWLTAYSPSLSNPEAFVDKARDIFPNAKAGYDRMNKTVKFKDEA